MLIRILGRSCQAIVGTIHCCGRVVARELRSLAGCKATPSLWPTRHSRRLSRNRRSFGLLVDAGNAIGFHRTSVAVPARLVGLGTASSESGEGNGTVLAASFAGWAAM